eukprot:5126879-Amphidinium_carterae.3
MLRTIASIYTFTLAGTHNPVTSAVRHRLHSSWHRRRQCHKSWATVAQWAGHSAQSTTEQYPSPQSIWADSRHMADHRHWIKADTRHNDTLVLPHCGDMDVHTHTMAHEHVQCHYNVQH